MWKTKIRVKGNSGFINVEFLSTKSGTVTTKMAKEMIAEKYNISVKDILSIQKLERV